MTTRTGPARPEDDAGRARRREQRGWYAYDWANSAFATTVVAVFLGPYLTAVAAEAAGCDPDAEDACTRPVALLPGVDVAAGSYYAYVLAAAVLLQVLVLPVVGALADRSGRKRFLLGGAALLGSLATAALYLVSGERYLLGGALYLAANACFGASLVVYNALLVDVAAPAERDRVSARGWALGYLGGGLLLLANLVLFSQADALGVDEGHAVRISLLSAGVWWAGFTLVPLALLRDRPAPPPAGRGARSVVRQLAGTVRDLRGRRMTLRFLVAYVVYNDGIQSVIALAAVYGAEELDLGQTTLILAILVVQVVAFGGALLLGRLARTLGAQRVVLGSLGLWVLVLVAAFFLQRGQAGQFLALAAAIGLVLGGSQALSRSLYSQLVPRERAAEYFSLYELSERGTSWIGALVFALAFELTGSYRVSILSIVAFFVVGAVLLARVDVARGAREAAAGPAPG